VPCLRVIRLDFPIHDYYRALRNDEEAVPPDREETFLAVTRRNFIVRHIRLSPPEAMMLAAIAAGATVGESIAGMDFLRESDLAGLAANIQNWFRTWSAEGFFLLAEVDGASHCEMLDE
jgi:hypothetical protein